MAFNDDFDRDGLANGIEAYFGTDPSVSNSGLRLVSTDGVTPVFTHPIADTVLSDVVGSYEWSPDLLNWYSGDGNDGPGGGPTVVITQSQTNGVATVIAVASDDILETFFLRVSVRN